MHNPKDISSPHMYSLLLASATKFPVAEEEQLILPPGVVPPNTMTYKEATEVSLCGQFPRGGKSQMIVVVTPILFSDDTYFRMETPIKPSKLHPLLDGKTLALLRSCEAATMRSLLFEEPFLHSVYARYLLVWWRKQRTLAASHVGQVPALAGLDSGWVLLEDVLTGALSDEGRKDLAGIEVCLSEGLAAAPGGGTVDDAVRDSLTWTGAANNKAHHDAYLWCRTAKEGSAGSGRKAPKTRPENPRRAVPRETHTQAMALQLRHSRPKENRELYSQVFAKSGDTNPMTLPLLVVYNDRITCEEGEGKWKKYCTTVEVTKKEQEALSSKVVFVDASAMCSTAWLEMVSREWQEKPGPKSVGVPTEKSTAFA
jgi:hypothetical protein